MKAVQDDGAFKSAEEAGSGPRSMPARLAAVQLDATALTVADQHRVKKVGQGGAKKKINPLKASKRGMKA